MNPFRRIARRFALPYAGLDQLHRVYRATTQSLEGNISSADHLELLKTKETYGDFTACSHGQVSLSDPGQLLLTARCAHAPRPLVDGIRTVMTELDLDPPVRRLQPADTTIARVPYQLGVLPEMLASFGVLGLGLASIGIYGIIARTTAQRTGEFAIRLALGAAVRDLTRIVLASGVRMALIGSTLGLAGAFAVSRLISAAFPGIRTNSPLILAFTTVVLVAIALLACWLPARRAGKVNPVDALRAE